MIKAVIFDIGGVTIKDPMIFIYKSIGRKFGRKWKEIEKIFDEIDPLISTNKISTKEFWSYLARELKIGDINSLERVWMESLRKAGTLNQNVVKIVCDVKRKGYKVATISNVINAHEKFHRKRGDYKFFDKVFLSNRLGVQKPDVRIYHYAAKKLGAKPYECVFIDDKTRNVLGAKKAGMKAIQFKKAAQVERELKKYL